MYESGYRCLDCGAEFDEPESYKSYVGEYWGEPVYEYLSVCPYCHGYFEPIVYNDDGTEYDPDAEEDDDEEDEEEE